MKFRLTYSENVTYTVDIEADDFQQAREEADDIVNNGDADCESNGIEFENIEWLDGDDA